MFAPMAADFSRVLRRLVAFRTTSTIEHFVDNLQQHVYDIAFVQPFDYVRVAAPAGYVLVAGRGESLHPLLVVLQESPFQELADLRHQTIASPPGRTASHLLLKRALHQIKLRPSREVTIQTYRSHDSCLHQVLIKTASACVTIRSILQQFEQNMQARLRILIDLPAVPGAAFVVHPRVPEHDREVLRSAMLTWQHTPAGQQLLSRAGFASFVPVADHDYNVVRQYWKELEDSEAQRPPEIPYCGHDCYTHRGSHGPGVVADAVTLSGGQP
jgi:ABC-type phosphate/phosphonate transport system substrate-binding protein